MRILGTICQADTGRAIANLIVRAYGRDLLFDELLGLNVAGLRCERGHNHRRQDCHDGQRHRHIDQCQPTSPSAAVVPSCY